MLLPWEDRRCVICLVEQDEPLTVGHVIPQSVGGRLAVRNICASCNSTLGHTVEAGLNNDPRIRLSIEELQTQIPGLAEKMRAGREFVARDDEALVRATPGREGFKILDSPQEGGSRIKDPQRAWDEIETTLRRRLGADDALVASVRAIHDAAPEGQLVELVPGLSIKKGSVSSFGLPFTEPLAEDLCFLSVAYMFLSVIVQGAIYDPGFDAIRNSLRSGGSSEMWVVESFLADRPHEPWHGLAIQHSVPHLVVQVRLFGQHAWNITLPKIKCDEERLPVRLYQLDLETGSESFT